MSSGGISARGRFAIFYSLDYADAPGLFDRMVKRNGNAVMVLWGRFTD